MASGLLNSSTSSISVDFTDLSPAGHTISVSALQFVPQAEGGRKLNATLLIDNGLAGQFTAKMTVSLRDLAYDEFGLFGNALDAKARKNLQVKF